MTSVIAILGLVLAAASLGWQLYTFLLSGSRVHVKARFGIFGSDVELVNEEGEVFHLPPDAILDLSKDFLSRAQRRPSTVDKAIVTIQNRGRLPVTIDNCIWQSETAETIGSPDTAPGISLPHRLGEHDQCISVVDLATVMALVDNGNCAGNEIEGEVWPMVVLGNGRTVRGNSLCVPRAARMLRQDSGAQTTIKITRRAALTYPTNSKKQRFFHSLTSRLQALGRPGNG